MRRSGFCARARRARICRAAIRRIRRAIVGSSFGSDQAGWIAYYNVSPKTSATADRLI